MNNEDSVGDARMLRKNTSTFGCAFGGAARRCHLRRRQGKYQHGLHRLLVTNTVLKRSRISNVNGCSNLNPRRHLGYGFGWSFWGDI